MRWKWAKDNPAVHVKNPEPRPGDIDPFECWEEIDAIADELDETSGSLVVVLAGTGVRPEEAFGAEWRDVDLEWRMLMVRRAFAKGSAEGVRQDDRFAARGPAALSCHRSV